MNKFLFSLVAFLVVVPVTNVTASTNLKTVTRDFDKMRNDMSATVTNPAHLPTLRLQSTENSPVVLIMHGLFRSPAQTLLIEEAFYKAGYHVVSWLLPGHFRIPLNAVDEVKPEDYIASAEEAFAWAKKISPVIVTSGVSTGGLLAYQLALRHPEDVRGAFLIAPAFNVTWITAIASYFGAALNIDSTNVLSGYSNPDGQGEAYLSAKAGVVVEQLTQVVMDELKDQKAAVPVSIVGLSLDFAVSKSAIQDVQSENPNFVEVHFVAPQARGLVWRYWDSATFAAPVFEGRSFMEHRALPGLKWSETVSFCGSPKRNSVQAIFDQWLSKLNLN